MGAARVYLSDSDWKRGVAYLLGHAGAAYVQIGPGENDVRELRTALHSVPPERLLLYASVKGVHPSALGKGRVRQRLSSVTTTARHLVLTLLRAIPGYLDQARRVDRPRAWWDVQSRLFRYLQERSDPSLRKIESRIAADRAEEWRSTLARVLHETHIVFPDTEPQEDFFICFDGGSRARALRFSVPIKKKSRASNWEISLSSPSLKDVLAPWVKRTQPSPKTTQAC